MALWDPGGGQPVRARSYAYVIATHVASSLFAAFLIGGMSTCAVRGVFEILGDVGGLALALVCYAGAGFLAAWDSIDSIRKRSRVADPMQVPGPATAAFSLILASIPVAFGALQFWATGGSEWVWLLLVVVATVAGFWWGTRTGCRKWEAALREPKSYGFPVAVASRQTPAPPPGEPPEAPPGA